MKTDATRADYRNGSQKAAESDPPINTEVLFSRCMGIASFAQALLGELQYHGKLKVDAIFRYAVQNELAMVTEAAHSLKGAAAIIAAERLREKAAEIEVAGSAGEDSVIFNLIQELRDEMDRCLEYIPTVCLETERCRTIAVSRRVGYE